MQMIATAFVLPFFILNTFGVVIAAIWLLVLWAWQPLLIGLAMMVFGTFLIGLALMPGMLVSAGGIALHEKGGFMRPVGWLLLAAGLFWTFLIMTAWAGQASFQYFIGRATDAQFWPLLLWAYAVATAPWAYMARKEMQSGNDAAMTSTFFLQIGCLVAMIILAFGGELATAQLALLSVMGVGFILSTILTALLAVQARPRGY